MIQQIATIGVYVTDQAQAKAFWTEKVGFALIAEYPMGPNTSWIEVAPPGAQSRLVLFPRTMMQDWKERKPSIVFETHNINETYMTLRANGVEFITEPHPMQWGTFATFKDPDGNEFGLRGETPSA